MFPQVSLSRLRKLFLSRVAAPAATVQSGFCLIKFLMTLKVCSESLMQHSNGVIAMASQKITMFVRMRQKALVQCSNCVIASTLQVAFVFGGATYGFAGSIARESRSAVLAVKVS